LRGRCRVCTIERESERERERERKREREKERDRERGRERDGERERARERKKERESKRERERKREREMERERERKRERERPVELIWAEIKSDNDRENDLLPSPISFAFAVHVAKSHLSPLMQSQERKKAESRGEDMYAWVCVKGRVHVRFTMCAMC
jgi:hypothetical protein